VRVVGSDRVAAVAAGVGGAGAAVATVVAGLARVRARIGRRDGVAAVAAGVGEAGAAVAAVVAGLARRTDVGGWNRVAAVAAGVGEAEGAATIASGLARLHAWIGRHDGVTQARPAGIDRPEIAGAAVVARLAGLRSAVARSARAAVPDPAGGADVSAA